jgi:TPP-dependent pyruvate/acetoin dehydrogenase alpha subunit
MAKGTKTRTAYENPVMPNAKLRQIYLGMVRARLLDQALSAGRRRTSAGATAGLEAALVSTSVDLGAHDVVSDAVGGGVVDFLRGTKLESVLRPDETTRKRGFKADCGMAGRLPSPTGVQERIWTVLGAAAALKALRVQEKAETPAGQSGVAVIFTRLGEVSPGLWRQALTFAAAEELPVIFVVLPAAAGKAKTGGVSAVALRHGIPGIAVDASDAVAIYRVAQEAIGRARIGGGAALMECVSFVIEGTKSGRKMSTDAIAGLEEYMLSRGVTTKAWMEREARSFAKRIAS